MTTNPSDLAAHVAGLVGSDRFSADFGTAKVHVAHGEWVAAHQALHAELPYFSWLSAVDWASEVAVGDPPDADFEERFEVLSCLGSTDGAVVVLATDVAKDDARIDSVTGVYGGADWHEREAAEMFGIEFSGHANLAKLYLPDSFEGHPLRKTFPLLSREVKPWPGTVDVEDMPSTENPEDGA